MCSGCCWGSGCFCTGVASKSFGSALVQVGETKAFASIVLQIGQPAQDTPDCGELGECLVVGLH